MNSFLNVNRTFFTYFLIVLIIITFFGFNFFISFIGNILLLLLLIPIFLFLIVLIGFNSYKSKVNICDDCGAISLGLNEKCVNCGADLENKINQKYKKPSESTIEIKAEEVK